MKRIMIILSIFLLVGCTNNDSIKEEKEVEFTNIRYRENHDNYACITFYGKGKYSMYDCDSEPTNYFFDSESECTYSYRGNKLYFDCKYQFQNNKDNYIEVLEWTEDIFKFKIEDEVKEFYKEETE